MHVQTCANLFVTSLCASAQTLLTHMGGVVVDDSEGYVIASFTSAAVALRWALTTMQLCMQAEWPQELLQNQLGGGYGAYAAHFISTVFFC